jgi:hypothetical protein
LWHDIKRDLSEYKVDCILDLKRLNVEEYEAIFKDKFSD